MAGKSLTDLECFNGLLNREKPQRIIHLETYPIGFAAIQAGKTIYDAYDDPEFSYKSQKQLAREMGWLFYPAYPSIGGGWGGESKLRREDYSQSPIPIRYAAEDEESAWNLEAPDLTTVPSVQKAIKFYRMSARDGEIEKAFEVTINTAGPFTMAAQICGMERMARWILKKPDLVHHLLRLTTDHIIQGASLWFEEFRGTGIVFYLSEPISANQIISPGQFEEFAFPNIREVHEKVLSMGYRHIFCHICGDHNGNLPHWSRIPMGDPGIISVGSEIDLGTAADFFPNDIIYGNIDPIIIQVGNQDEIYEAAKQVVLKGKEIPNGFIFGPGCELPPRAGRDSMMIMAKAIEDFGSYE